MFMNLCGNGIYAAHRNATETGGTAKLSMASRKEGGTYVISVSDNGGGIPSAIQSKIFDPFFTTKPPGEGTGLGLSMSFDIVTRHGGTMDFQSTAGEGTTFVRLPASA